MKYNKEYDNSGIIKRNQTKYQFIGFIVGITPFILLLGIISLKEGGMEFIPSILKNTLILAGIITAIINSFTLKNMFINKLKSSLN